MNISRNLRKRHIWVEKAKESTEKSKHLKKNDPVFDVKR
jgi:hypothetical protein